MTKAKKRVLLLGWDAADWQIIDPLLQQGKMPALKQLLDRGVRANMSTMDPPYSPMLWTSVATGKTPDKHGVLNFIEVNQNNELQPVTVHSRRTRAIWNIFTAQHLHSNIIGWWPTHPVEPIRGIMVSDKFQKNYSKGHYSKWPIQPHAVHPVELEAAFATCRMHPGEVTEAHIKPFIPKAELINQQKDKSLLVFSKILAQNVSIHAAATKAMRETDWDFMAVYYDAIDHFCHAFMKFHPPKLPRVPEQLFELYHEVVTGAYLFQDMMLERMMKLADENTTIIVMSDHGYESGKLRMLKMPKFAAAPALEHRQFGIFAAAGPEFKQGENIFGLNLFDIAPTLLHHFDLPVGKDMDGQVIQDLYKNPKPVQYIESWDTVAGHFGEHDKSTQIDSIESQEQLQQLIALGYVDKLEEDKEQNLRKVKCTVKHNLARVHKGKKDYDTAVSLLLELIKEPVDTTAFYIDLLNISLVRGEYEQAARYLKTLRTLKSEFAFSTTVVEAKIAIGLGNMQQALQLLQAAKTEKPTAAIWYELGKTYLKLDNFEEAKAAFLKALDIEMDNARFHQALCVTYNRLEQYEQAVGHGFKAIELIKFFPEAHYALGEALQNIGETEMAKAAFENAKRLKPRTHHRATHALQNLKLQEQEREKAYTKFKKSEILIVSGLPRSGTSLMMQMLSSAGLDILSDGVRDADTSNPKGYYEYEAVKGLAKQNDWLHLAQGKALKVVAPLLKFLDQQYRYKIIFMRRDLQEIIASQQKMIGKKTDVFPLALFKSYEKTLQAVEAWCKKEPGVSVLYVDHKVLLTAPDPVLDSIRNFIDPDLDVEKMKACIDQSLYRNVL